VLQTASMYSTIQTRAAYNEALTESNTIQKPDSFHTESVPTLTRWFTSPCFIESIWLARFQNILSAKAFGSRAFQSLSSRKRLACTLLNPSLCESIWLARLWVSRKCHFMFCTTAVTAKGVRFCYHQEGRSSKRSVPASSGHQSTATLFASQAPSSLSGVQPLHFH
jgi:hypothetical protein